MIQKNKNQSNDGLTFSRKQLAILVLLVAVASAAGGGAVSLLLMTRSAQAQQPLPTNNSDIIVPSKGLLFKASDGKTLAKLASDPNGVSFIIYNSQGTPAVGTYGLNLGGSLNIFDKRGSQSLSLIGQDDGGILTLLSGIYGKRVVEVAAGRNGGDITINNNTGEPVITIKAEPIGQKIGGSLSIYSGDSSQIEWKTPN